MHQKLLMLCLLLLKQMIDLLLLLLLLSLVCAARAPGWSAVLCMRGQHICQRWRARCDCCSGLGSCNATDAAAAAAAACQVAWQDAAMRAAHLQRHSDDTNTRG
jgi:hypothetical protein